MDAFETYPNLYQLVAAYLDRDCSPESSKPPVVKLIAGFLDESSQDELVDLSEEINKFCFNYSGQLDERFAEFFRPDMRLEPVDQFLNFLKAQVWIKLGVFTPEEIPVLSQRTQAPDVKTPARDFLCNKLRIKQTRATTPLFNLALYLDRRKHLKSAGAVASSNSGRAQGASIIEGKYRAGARSSGDPLAQQDLYPQMRKLMKQLTSQSDENSPGMSRLIALNQFFASCDDKTLTSLGQEVDLFEALHHSNIETAFREEFQYFPTNFTTTEIFDLLATRIEECRNPRGQ